MEEAQVVGLLVRRCISGDAAAWEEIVQRYHRRIYNVCYRFAGDAENAQDLTQEVFIKMYRTLNTYDSGKGAFMTWVTTITRNLLVDHFRKTKGDRITDSLDTVPSEHEDAQPYAAVVKEVAEAAKAQNKLRASVNIQDLGESSLALLRKTLGLPSSPGVRCDAAPTQARNNRRDG